MTTGLVRTPQLSRLPYQAQHSPKLRVVWAHLTEEKWEQGDRFGWCGSHSKDALLKVDSFPEASEDAAIKVKYMNRMSRNIARYR